MMPTRELESKHAGADVLTVQPLKRIHAEWILFALPLQEKVDVGVGGPKRGEVLGSDERNINADQVKRDEQSQSHYGPQRRESGGSETPTQHRPSRWRTSLPT